MVHLLHHLYGVDAPGVRSPVVDEERMRPGRWLGLVLCVPLTLMVLWREGHPLVPRGSVLEYVEEEDPRRNWVTEVHLEKHH